jgi:NTP pyrophosphatase (non-canonical NTP hydrolase)
MDIQKLLAACKLLNQKLDKKYPIDDREKRVFAYVTKLMEENGELAEMILARSKLQRGSKKLTNIDENLASEFTDVLITLLILGNELELDVEKIVEARVEKILGEGR